MHVDKMLPSDAGPRELLRSLSYADDFMRTEAAVGGAPLYVLGHAMAPLVPRNACIAACVLPIGVPPPGVVRALGDASAAPIVLLVSAGAVEWWCPDHREASGARLVASWAAGGIDEIPAELRALLDPRSVLRARLATRHLGGFQLSLFGDAAPTRNLELDPSLLSRFEEQQADRLGEFVERVLNEVGRSETLDTVELRYQAITLSFWIVASRILRDAGVPSFQGIDYGDPRDVLGRVSRHYNAAIPVAAGRPGWPQSLAAACSLADSFWGVSAAQIGPEVLGRVNETMRIGPDQRKLLGAHSTPTFLIDYMVGGLADHILGLEDARRIVAEPACGHAGFLVAAARVLASALPPGSDRHSYLREHLRGHDLDVVSAEVARLSLTLADIPHPDGWAISSGTDMFASGVLEALIRDAGVVLANPPFENFSPEERASLADADVFPTHPSRAVETFRRCMEAAAPGTLLGFVLPPGLLDAPSQKAVQLRRAILASSDVLEVTELPDGVFNEAETGCFTILVRTRAVGDVPRESWPFSRVTEPGLLAFRRSGVPTDVTTTRRADVLSDPLCSFRLPVHSKVWSARSWERLEGCVAGMGQGGSLNAGAPRSAAPEQWIDHLTLGAAARDCVLTGAPPRGTTARRVGATPVMRRGAASGRPRVVLNRARRSREAWWLQAFLDPDGLEVLQDGFIVEPGDGPWTAELLWGVLNSAFANVFVRSQGTERDVTPGMLNRLPMPALTDAAKTALQNQILQCRRADPPAQGSHLAELMTRLDAVIHALLGLPAAYEWELIDELADSERPGVGWYPAFEGYNRRIPLYLQLGMDVPLPAEAQIAEGRDREALFDVQDAIYQELAAFSSKVNIGAAGERRVEWLVAWKRALQRREVALLPAATLSTDEATAREGGPRAHFQP